MKLTVSFPRSGLSLAFDNKSVATLVKMAAVDEASKVGVALVRAEKLTKSIKMHFSVVAVGTLVGNAHVASMTHQPNAQDYPWRCRWTPDRSNGLGNMLAHHGVLELDGSSTTLSKDGFVLQYDTDKLPRPITRVHAGKVPGTVKAPEMVLVSLTMPDGAAHKFKVTQTEAFNLAMRWASEGRAFKE